MDNDFLIELEYLGVTARLKRLSDALFYNIKDLYKTVGLDIEPSWHLVFLLLKSRGTCSIKELAGAFHLSQPAATKMISKMIKKNYLDFVRDNNDKRRKLVCLSEKAIDNFSKLEKIWHAGRFTIKEMLKDNPSFLASLTLFEGELGQIDFKERVLNNLK